MAEPPRRMTSLISSCGAPALAEAAGLCLSDPPERRSIGEPCPIGQISINGKHCFGVGVAFGTLDANMLDAAATAASTFGNEEIRLTPWRALIVPHVAAGQVGAIAAYFELHRFIVDAKDPRLAIAACGGALTCEHGTTDTRADALAIMPFVGRLSQSGVAIFIYPAAPRAVLGKAQRP